MKGVRFSASSVNFCLLHAGSCLAYCLTAKKVANAFLRIVSTVPRDCMASHLDFIVTAVRTSDASNSEMTTHDVSVRSVSKIYAPWFLACIPCLKRSTCLWHHARCLLSIVTGRTTEGSMFDCHERVRFVSAPQRPDRPLGPTQRPVQWVPGSVAQIIKQQGHNHAISPRA
jgi:hypothetical protein